MVKMECPLVPERGQEDDSVFIWEETVKSKRIISYILYFALLLWACAPMHVYSDEAIIGEGAFDYRITDAGAEVIKYYVSQESQVEVPAQVQGHPVVAIGKEVFKNQANITKIILPEGLLSVEDRAFYACSDLVEIKLPQSLTAIGEMAFSNCFALEAVQIPQNVNQIGMSAFLNCTALQSLQVAEGNPCYAAVDSVLFSADMKTLLAYPNAQKATSYTVPQQVQCIAEKAFLECSYLQSVTFPSGLLEIEKYAFSGCTALVSVQIPDSVEQIGNFAFNNCDALTSVEMGAGITAVPAYGFYSCSSLQSATFSDELRSIGSKAFANCGTVWQVVIPDSVEQIAEDAFSNTVLTRVRFYSTQQKENFVQMFSGSEILCLCKAEHTYLPDSPVDCWVCDYALDVSIPPVLQEVTHDTVQLVVQMGFEYSYDQLHWRTDGFFENLVPNETYAFYARVQGDQTGQVSQPLSVTTYRAQQEKAPAPVIQGTDATSVTLQTHDGCEYSLDGITWQSSPVFTGLQVNTQYTFYQRYAQTKTHFSGAVSEPTTGKTTGVTSLSSDKYTISQNVIRKIPASTTVKTLLQGIRGGEYCAVYQGSTRLKETAVVGTGMTVKLMQGSAVSATYTLIVTGDTNGDGGITITDMIAVKAHLLGKKLLTGMEAQAADTNGEGGITITDFIQIKAKLLGKGNITAR